jgi:DNA-binding CsgD family transcriptional regulator
MTGHMVGRSIGFDRAVWMLSDDKAALSASTGTCGLTGREPELRLLHQAVQDSANGRLVRCLLTGEMGMGRTSLLHEFHARTGGESHYHMALTCSGPEGRPTSGFLASLCQQTVRLAPDDARVVGLTELTDGPVLRSLEECPDAWASADDSRLASALQSALARVAKRRPLIVTLDDAQSADQASLRVLLRVLTALSDSRLLFVATARTGEPRTAPEQLDELALEARHIRLRALGLEDVAELIRSLTGALAPVDFVSACHRATAGNPLMAVHLIRALRDDGPDALRPEAIGTVVIDDLADLLTQRLNRLAPRAVQLAMACAVVGGAVRDPLLVAHLSGLTVREALEVADRMVRMRLMENNDKFALRPPVVRSALAGSMTLMARNAAHLSAAAYLYDKRAPVEQIAHHLAASTVPADGRWPTGVLMDAGDRALARHDVSAAVRYLRRARQSASGEEQARVTQSLIDAEMLVNTRNGLDEALSALKDVHDGATRQRLLSRIGTCLFLRARPEEGRRFLASAAATLSGTELSDWPRMYQQLTEAACGERGKSMSFPTDGTRTPAGPDVPDSSVSARMQASASAVLHVLHASDPASAVSQAEAVLHAGRFPYGHPLAVAVPLWTLIKHGRFATATAHLRRYEQASEKEADPWLRTELLSASAMLALYEGKVTSAAEILRDCLRILDAYGTRHDHQVRTWIVGMLACVLLTGGENKATEALLRQQRCMSGLIPGPAWGAQEMLVARAWLRAHVGDVANAARDLDDALQADGPGFWYAWSALGVDLLCRIGRLTDARHLAQTFLRRAQAADAPDLRAIALRMLGSALGGRQGERLAHQAACHLRSGPARLELAHALACLGELQSASHGSEVAVTTLTEALHLASRCQARLLSERVGRRLAVIEGASSRTSPLRGVLSLTPRERQVLADAVRGQTNESISQRLHITRRTVELHLSSAYRKLGVKGRRELPAVFERDGMWDLLSG